jgi:hypothetical protein
MTTNTAVLPTVAYAPAPVRHDLVHTPDGFIARVKWVFDAYGERCANVQRLGGTPGTFPVRLLTPYQEGE